MWISISDWLDGVVEYKGDKLSIGVVCGKPSKPCLTCSGMLHPTA